MATTAVLDALIELRPGAPVEQASRARALSAARGSRRDRRGTSWRTRAGDGLDDGHPGDRGQRLVVDVAPEARGREQEPLGRRGNLDAGLLRARVEVEDDQPVAGRIEGRPAGRGAAARAWARALGRPGARAAAAGTSRRASPRRPARACPGRRSGGRRGRGRRGATAAPARRPSGARRERRRCPRRRRPRSPARDPRPAGSTRSRTAAR